MHHQDTTMAWFETWFESPYYHLLYANHDTAKAQQLLDPLLKFIVMPQGSRVLDVACGRGRHSIYLNEKGFEVTGIDLSAKNIHQAIQLAGDNISFYVQDMRKIDKTSYFDAVFNLFTSFGYFDSEEEHNQAVHSMGSALKSGGLLVIDFFNAEKVISAIPIHETVSVPPVEFRINKKVEGKTIIKTITFSDKGKDYSFTEYVKAFRLSDFEKFFLSNQLKVKSVFGDYSLNKFDAQHSDRLIIIAEKD